MVAPNVTTGYVGVTSIETSSAFMVSVVEADMFPEVAVISVEPLASEVANP